MSTKKFDPKATDARHLEADERRALAGMWIAELWTPCRELSRGERAEQRESAVARNIAIAECSLNVDAA